MPNANIIEAKKATVAALTERIKNSTAGVFVTYEGISVADDTKLRASLRKEGIEYTVVKNTLTRRAAQEAGYTEFDEIFNGTTAFASTEGDPILPARLVSEFAKQLNSNFAIKGGYVEGRALPLEEIQALSTLPSKDALLAQVLGTFLAPISSLACVLDQIAKKQEVAE